MDSLYKNYKSNFNSKKARKDLLDKMMEVTYCWASKFPNIKIDLAAEFLIYIYPSFEKFIEDYDESYGVPFKYYFLYRLKMRAINFIKVFMRNIENVPIFVDPVSYNYLSKKNYEDEEILQVAEGSILPISSSSTKEAVMTSYLMNLSLHSAKNTSLISKIVGCEENFILDKLSTLEKEHKEYDRAQEEVADFYARKMFLEDAIYKEYDQSKKEELIKRCKKIERTIKNKMNKLDCASRLSYRRLSEIENKSLYKIKKDMQICSDKKLINDILDEN